MEGQTRSTQPRRREIENSSRPSGLLLPALLALSILAAGCTAAERGGGAAGPSQDSGVVTSTPTPAAPAASPQGESAGGDLKTQKNLLAFGAGALIVDKTSESAGDKARYLIDEATFFWQSEDGKIENQGVTLELPAPTVLKTVGFDTSQPTYYDGRAAKDVLVEVSPDSPSENFQPILAATLAADKDGQNFAVERETPARYVRVTVRSNHGSRKAVLIKEVRGYGAQEPQQPLASVSGTYGFGDYGELHLKQEGASVVGCYQYNGGLVEGTIEGRTLALRRTEADGKRGFVAVNFVGGGRKFISTVWDAGATKDYDILREGEKKSDKVGNCQHLPDLDAGDRDAAKDRLAADLEKAGGRAVLYGINFDFNSDRIRDESRPVLDKVVALLKEKADWRLTVEGHTDNVGGEAFNQTLSERRAAAVKNYLVAAGVELGRLSAVGLGLSKPVAGNESEAGRAQNRRVELFRQ